MNLKKFFGKVEDNEEYVEIDLNSTKPKDNKIAVRPYVLKQYDDINEILNGLREGYTIAVIDIKILKTKDVIELKRAVSKLKKTVDAIEGSIAGFGENILIITPKFAEIHKSPVLAEKSRKVDFLN
ncbi:hypothetical protein COU54_04910 [Candidatus Pacearchaeota archaeon CG10_big_fil_rev_8_21_14_0_10_31_24]|nr:MAG: hypothetical protein COU54_04910 [Candidatus Pacearchaeota archaeon CG10_big_fil_rev_8_21_14_0_10_31_24]